MNQRVRQSLSALMDGESSEFETRRLLKSLADEAPDEADSWRRYHVASSLMRGERAIDVGVDISAAVRERIETESMVPLAPEQSAARRASPFSFMGNAAIAAAVSLMVMTGVQVYRANSGVESVPAAGGELASGSMSAREGAGMVGSDGSMASLAAFRGGDSGGGVMPIGARTSWFTAPGAQDASRNDRQQAQVLESYLDRHVEQAGHRSNAWMSGIQLPGDSGGDTQRAAR